MARKPTSLGLTKDNGPGRYIEQPADKQIIAGVADGLTDAEIADRIGKGLTGYTVKSRVHYLRRRGVIFAKRKDRTFWTPKVDEALMTMVDQGMTDQQIATSLGLASRNAVSGRIHRLKRQGTITRNLTAKRRPNCAYGQAGNSVPRERLKVNYKPARADRIAPVPARDVNGGLLTIESIGAEQCRFPHGEPGAADFHLCGQPSPEGEPYCGYHHRRTHVSKTPIEEEAA